MAKRTLVIDSLSKRFAMTGYRVGFAVGYEEIIANMTKLQENIAACAPLPSQYAGIAAFLNCAEDTFIADEFEERRNFMYQAINSIEGLSCIKPAATFYLFVNIDDLGLDSKTFAYKLLEKEQVAVVPGITYGDNYDNYFRIAYTMKIDVLEQAVERIRRFVQGLEK
jgi:aminotransferase